MNYYNEFDKGAAQWLRNLIDAKLIPAGVVDERSIKDVKPSDLLGFTQCHFFAGIGGWPLALQLAGWPSDRPVWTGSCPCQPYSAAGKQLGDADERNLWPAFFGLIRERKPDAVFGEQVESAIRHGWLDGISTDLEGEGYTCGHAVLGAHSIGAPHIRQRLYWVADASGTGRSQLSRQRNEPKGFAAVSRPDYCRLSDANLPSEHERASSREQSLCNEDEGRDFWGDNWIACADGKARRIEPGLSPLAHGVPARVVRLRGYGNAIIPQVAAEFVRAFLEA